MLLIVDDADDADEECYLALKYLENEMGSDDLSC